jgi:DnaJ-class molecular chaperone
MSQKEESCKRCHGTGYIPSETCDMGCVDCQDKCPDCGGSGNAGKESK